ncbi:SRPBCC domain-containing protein [Planotetraspora phitsanulokensis]|uniref:Activator of HSP90 ATPase n=1 Tax=Planotetraspora phitsanulokensis TaxID=575192 RepID=A0A8J3UDS6_9ACTN|nr:SRPBCC domain-containing protein [Planotetraspora phitsanulokensis]GII43007.1 activator of HSP90 ATPase [Planotetraspora phitsanulokensis]
MTQTAEYDITRVFNARRELVWAAWTEPERFSRWFGPRMLATPVGRITLDTRPGGIWQVVLVGEEGFEVTLGGTYREVEGPGRLVFTTGDPDSPGEGPASVVTIDFTPVDGGDRTEMRFHQYGVNTDEEHAEQARAGWIEFFDRLAEQVN